jgi:hypothetical protein
VQTLSNGLPNTFKVCWIWSKVKMEEKEKKKLKEFPEEGGHVPKSICSLLGAQSATALPEAKGAFVCVKTFWQTAAGMHTHLRN